MNRRRLLSVRAGLYGGGNVVVVNYRNSSVSYVGFFGGFSVGRLLTLDSRQFLPDPGAPRSRIRALGYSSRPILTLDYRGITCGTLLAMVFSFFFLVGW